MHRLLTIALALLALAGPARAQDEAQLYKGQTVKFLVPFGTGGGYDAYARMLAPHLAKRLGASVVVENMPGAGGLAAINRVATSPPDGLQIIIIQGTGAALAQLVGQSGVRYDLAEASYIATVAASPWMWLVQPKSPIRTVADALKHGKRITWGASGPQDGLSDGAIFTCEALKLECNVVLGYKGSNDVALALARGEMDALYVSDTSAHNYVKSGQAHAVAAVGRKKSRFFPDTPTLFEQASLEPEAAWLIDFHSTLEDLGRIVIAPPRMPAARLAFLQRVMMDVLTDPAVTSEGERSQRYIDFEDADTTRKRVLAVLRDITPEQKARVIGLLKKVE